MCYCLKTKVFCRKNNQIHFPIAKIGADSLTENTPNAPKLISNIFSEDKRSAQKGQKTQLKEVFSSEEITTDNINSEEYKYTTEEISFEEEIPEDISDEQVEDNYEG